MKKTTLIGIVFILATSHDLFSQCPPTGLKIITPACDSARSFIVIPLSCSQAKAQWKGNVNQKYLLKAIITDTINNSSVTLKAIQYSCNEKGICGAQIKVKPGERVEAFIQSVCSLNGMEMYGTGLASKIIYIPACSFVSGSSEDKSEIKETGRIKVYPNPSNGSLKVGYNTKTFGVVDFKVIDIGGNMVFHSTENAKSNMNQYAFDLHNLSNGSYVLQISNGSEVFTNKFIILKR